MLSQHERRELAAIERFLSEEDPELARTLGAGAEARRAPLHRVAWFVLGLVLLAGAVCGLGLLLAVVGVVSLVVAMLPQPLQRGWGATTGQRWNAPRDPRGDGEHQH